MLTCGLHTRIYLFDIDTMTVGNTFWLNLVDQCDHQFSLYIVKLQKIEVLSSLGINMRNSIESPSILTHVD